MTIELSESEMADYLDKFYNRLLEHRYRYYVLDNPVISDSEYDFIEREYNRLAAEHGAKLMEMVDFNTNDPLAVEAKNRVDNKEDYFSLWEKSMQPVWDRIGKTNKVRKAEE